MTATLTEVVIVIASGGTAVAYALFGGRVLQVLSGVLGIFAVIVGAILGFRAGLL